MPIQRSLFFRLVYFCCYCILSLTDPKFRELQDFVSAEFETKSLNWFDRIQIYNREHEARKRNGDRNMTRIPGWGDNHIGLILLMDALENYEVAQIVINPTGPVQIFHYRIKSN